MSKPIDITGMRYGRLTAIRRIGTRSRAAMWLFLCSCGNEYEGAASQVRYGKARSCGCLKAEAVKTTSLKHGMTGTPEHNAWMGMISRCHNKNNSRYADYGGRGIYVCVAWKHSFEQFIRDVGARPVGGSLDRKDNNGPYSPENCRWATRHQQANNTRANKTITCRGMEFTEAQWAKMRGIKRSTLQHRLSAGWPTLQALEYEPRPEAERYRSCRLKT